MKKISYSGKISKHPELFCSQEKHFIGVHASDKR